MTLTDFKGFNILIEIENFVNENNDILENLQTKEVFKSIDDDLKPNIGPLLKTLLETSKANYGKLSKGYRYDESIKRFSAILYLLSGKKAYELMSANLKSSLPSLTTVKKTDR